MVGRSLSGISGTKTTPNYLGWDAWVVRFDAEGNQLWDRTYGGSGFDVFNGAAAMPDGTFALIGESSSGVSGNKTSPPQGGSDVWLVRIDGDGNVLSDLTFGGDGDDYGRRVAALPDGGLLITAGSASDLLDLRGVRATRWDEFDVGVQTLGRGYRVASQVV